MDNRRIAEDISREQVRRRDAPKLHRERALAQTRAAVADAMVAIEEAEAWLVSIGMDEFYTDRTRSALAQLESIASLLDPDRDLVNGFPETGEEDGRAD